MRRSILIFFALAACGPVEDFNGYDALEGEVTFTTTTSEGTVVCDADLALTGTPYTASCSDCEFAFHVEPSILEDRGSADCVLPSLWTYVDDDFIDRSGLGYADATVDIDGQPLDRALVAVGDLEGRRPAAAGVVSDDGARSMVDWDGETTLTWSHEFDELYGETELERRTCDDQAELRGGRPGDGRSAEETLDCAGFVLDVWTVELVAGETVHLGMDTVAADTAFDSVLFVENPDGCIVASGDDVFSCSFAPAAWSCGGGKFTPEVSGTHRILAYSYGSCTDDDHDGDGVPDVSAYRLTVESETEPKLTLEHDDLPMSADRLTTLVEGQVTVHKVEE